MKFTALTLGLTFAAANKLRQQGGHPRREAYKALDIFDDSSSPLSLSSSESEETFQGKLPSFMHTSDQIHEELKKLQDNCEGATFELKTLTKKSLITEQSVDIDLVSIKGTNTKQAAKNKVFFLFGEHARELISPESALHFMKQLCSGSQRAKDTLELSEFQIIPNGNPGSRKAVEEGDFCVRTNPAGIDLNRNWDSHWQQGASMGADTNPGNRPFSELETQIFKEAVTAYNPTSFLTIHSGTLGMYMPWAFDMEHLASKNQPEMMQILQEVDKTRCECPFGAAGKEVGYSCPGTCLDWVFTNLDTQYAFAYEIYYGGDHNQLKERWQAKVDELKAKKKTQSLLGAEGHLAHDDIKDFFKDYPSGFVQLNSSSVHQHQAGKQDRHQEGKHRGEHGEASFDCFGMFNPDTSSKYTETVENWSEAYFDTVDKITAKL